MEDNEEDTTCPTCGREDFSSERGMKYHHSTVHGESIAGVTVICEVCGDEYSVSQYKKENSKCCSMECLHEYQSETKFVDCDWCGEENERIPSNIDKYTFCDKECEANYWAENNSGEDCWHWKDKVEIECEYCEELFTVIKDNKEEHKFCSHECYGKWRENNISGEDIHNYKGKVINVCEICGEEYKVTPSEEQRRRFCSNKCYGIYRSKNITGEKHHQWEGGDITVECKNCGEEYKVGRHRKDESKFCSNSCHNEWRSNNLTGKEHPNWKENSVSYPYIGFEPVRKEILERDSFKCQRCGMSEERHKEEFGRGLEVHHIYKLRKFFEDVDDTIINSLSSNNLNKLSTTVVEMIYNRSEVAHDKSNLVTVCSDCHRGKDGLEHLPVDEQVELVCMDIPEVSPEDVIESSE